MCVCVYVTNTVLPCEPQANRCNLDWILRQTLLKNANLHKSRAIKFRVSYYATLWPTMCKADADNDGDENVCIGWVDLFEPWEV